jgi:hypothetical protein
MEPLGFLKMVRFGTIQAGKRAGSRRTGERTFFYSTQLRAAKRTLAVLDQGAEPRLQQ